MFINYCMLIVNVQYNKVSEQVRCLKDETNKLSCKEKNGTIKPVWKMAKLS